MTSKFTISHMKIINEILPPFFTSYQTHYMKIKISYISHNMWLLKSNCSFYRLQFLHRNSSSKCVLFHLTTKTNPIPKDATNRIVSSISVTFLCHSSQQISVQSVEISFRAILIEEHESWHTKTNQQHDSLCQPLFCLEN